MVWKWHPPSKVARKYRESTAHFLFEAEFVDWDSHPLSQRLFYISRGEYIHFRMIKLPLGKDGKKKEKEKDHRFTHARLFYGRKQKKKRKQSGLSACATSHPSLVPNAALLGCAFVTEDGGIIALSHLQQKEDAEVLSYMGALTEKEPRRDTSFGIPCSCWPIDKETRPRASTLALAWRLDTRSYFHPVPWLQSYHGHYCSSLP